MVLILLLAFTFLMFPLVAILLQMTLLVTMITFPIAAGRGLATTLIFIFAFSSLSRSAPRTTSALPFLDVSTLFHWTSSIRRLVSNVMEDRPFAIVFILVVVQKVSQLSSREINRNNAFSEFVNCIP